MHHSPAAASAALVLIFLAQAAAADEAGNASIVMQLERAFTAIEHADGQRLAGTLAGVTMIAGSDQSPLPAGPSSPTVCVGHGSMGTEVHVVAHCTLTDADGDRLFVSAERRDGTLEDGGGGKGDMLIRGGTGKYAGLEHLCPYVADYLPENRMVVNATCRW